MNDKEKADCLIELHKERMNHYRQTREIEWKVNIALWTIIVLAGYYLNSEIYLKDCWYVIGYISISIIIIVCHYCLWLIPISRSLRIDHHYSKEYCLKVEELANQTIKNPNIKKPGKNWANFEAAITFILLLLVGILLGI